MTHQEIEKIAEKWAFKAAEEAENSGGFDVPDQFIEFIVGAIAEATALNNSCEINPELHGCTIDECQQIAKRYRNRCIDLERKLATEPTWTKELPKEVHKCTPITEYATRTTPVKIKCIECGREL